MLKKLKKQPLLLKIPVLQDFVWSTWRNPTDRDLEIVCNMIKKVSSLGLETCATLGMLNKEQAKSLQMLA